MDRTTPERPNCLACRHFYISHDPRHPYGCRAMGFKARQLPAVLVLASSGLPCQLFASKEKKRG
jgi:hypothetical protein